MYLTHSLENVAGCTMAIFMQIFSLRFILFLFIISNIYGVHAQRREHIAVLEWLIFLALSFSLVHMNFWKCEFIMTSTVIEQQQRQ